MLKGIDLTLLIGPAVPVPAPKAVTDALTDIQVTSGRDRSGFQLTFAVSKTSTLLTTLLPAGYFDPITTRVIIIVTLKSFPHVIMDGLVTRQEVSPSSDPGQFKLTITGEDLSVAMDLLEIVTPFPNMPDTAQINLLLLPYLVLGIVPVVIPPISFLVKTVDQGFESVAKMTTLAYIKSLATRCGYVFYVEPGPLPFQSIAYFGPDVNLPVPQPALSINVDAHTNVESMSFALDGTAKTVRIFRIMDPVTKRIPIPIPVPNVNVFKPPLGLRPTAPAKIELNKEGAKQTAGEAIRDILGFMMNSPASITGNGSLDVVRYGQLLRARMVVGVRGASLAYDGMYYVDSVTHTIKRGEYKQSFTVSRDGLLPQTPRVLT